MWHVSRQLEHPGMMGDCKLGIKHHGSSWDCMSTAGIVAICLLVAGVVWRIFLIRRLIRGATLIFQPEKTNKGPSFCAVDSKEQFRSVNVVLFLPRYAAGLVNHVLITTSAFPLSTPKNPPWPLYKVLPFLAPSITVFCHMSEAPFHIYVHGQTCVSYKAV